METLAQNRDLPLEEKQARLRAAKGGNWYEGWRPYCLNCSTIHRMEAKSFGFQCNNCKNLIGFNLTRLRESPLNN